MITAVTAPSARPGARLRRRGAGLPVAPEDEVGVHGNPHNVTRRDNQPCMHQICFYVPGVSLIGASFSLPANDGYPDLPKKRWLIQRCCTAGIGNLSWSWGLASLVRACWAPGRRRAGRRPRVCAWRRPGAAAAGRLPLAEGAARVRDLTTGD